MIIVKIFFINIYNVFTYKIFLLPTLDSYIHQRISHCLIIPAKPH